MKNIPALLTVLAIFIVGLLVLNEFKGPSEIEIRSDERKKTKKEVEYQLDSLRNERKTLKLERDSLRVLADSVRRDFEVVSAESLKKDREIAKLKGKYKNVPQDSLGIMMDRRAEQNAGK